jgi:hypothetical protein
MPELTDGNGTSGYDPIVVETDDPVLLAVMPSVDNEKGTKLYVDFNQTRADLNMNPVTCLWALTTLLTSFIAEIPVIEERGAFLELFGKLLTISINAREIDMPHMTGDEDSAG